MSSTVTRLTQQDRHLRSRCADDVAGSIGTAAAAARDPPPGSSARPRTPGACRQPPRRDHAHRADPHPPPGPVPAEPHRVACSRAGRRAPSSRNPRLHRISSDLAWNPAGARRSLSLKLPVASSAFHRLETAVCGSSPWNPCWSSSSSDLAGHTS
jgi:hypothetical protein